MISICDYHERTALCVITAVQRKLDILKQHLQQDGARFPSGKEIQGANITSHAAFAQKLTENFKDHFDGFALEAQLHLFMKNPFLLKNIPAFLQEDVHVCKWVDVGSLQTGLVYFQADIQEQCAASDPAAFWMQTVPKTTFPGLTKVAVALTMF